MVKENNKVMDKRYLMSKVLWVCVAVVALVDSSFAADIVPGVDIRNGLRNSYEVFRRGDKACVAFLGGSITQGNGWRNHVAESLKKRFPETEFTFLFKGIGSTDSTMGAFRLESDIFSEGMVDLLFIESAVNELHNDRKDLEISRATEGIVRHALFRNPKIDIVAQYFYDKPYMKAVREGKMPRQIKALDSVSVHYDIPSVNQIILLNEAIEKGVITQKQFGACHPSKLGHKFYGENLDRLFDMVLNDGFEVKREIPVPLDKANYSHGRFVSIKRADIVKGWKYIDKWEPVKGRVRDGFSAVPVLESTESGSELRFEFKGTAVGIIIPAGHDAGIIEYSIDEEAFMEQDLFTRWSGNLHIPWIHILGSDLSSGSHVLTIRMSTKKNISSAGTACRIIKFVINQYRCK